MELNLKRTDDVLQKIEIEIENTNISYNNNNDERKMEKMTSVSEYVAVGGLVFEFNDWDQGLSRWCYSTIDRYGLDQIGVQSKSLIEEIICPNRVWLDKESINTDYNHGVFQRIPTSFQLCLNEKGKDHCLKFDELKQEYIDIKLNSFYIGDINEKYYPKLYPLMLKLLKTKIIPMRMLKNITYMCCIFRY